MSHINIFLHNLLSLMPRNLFQIGWCVCASTHTHHPTDFTRFPTHIFCNGLDKSILIKSQKIPKSSTVNFCTSFIHCITPNPSNKIQYKTYTGMIKFNVGREPHIFYSGNEIWSNMNVVCLFLPKVIYVTEFKINIFYKTR